MGKRVSERATRGGDGRNTAVSGHCIHVVRLGNPSAEPVRTRRLRSLGGARVLLGGSSAWCVVQVSRRRGGPPAYRPSGRGPGCGFASDRAIPPPSQAGVGFVLWLGSPVWFLAKLGRRGIKLRRHQGPTSGGVGLRQLASFVGIASTVRPFLAGRVSFGAGGCFPI